MMPLLLLCAGEKLERVVVCALLRARYTKSPPLPSLAPLTLASLALQHYACSDYAGQFRKMHRATVMENSRLS